MATFFLGCFAFGLIFTVASFLLGAFGGSHHFHLFDFHVDVGGPGGDAQGQGSHHGATISPFNLSTISAFLAWFGGAGYLLTRYSTLPGLAITAAATGAGVVGGGIVFVVLAKWIMPGLGRMRPEDYRIDGAIARVTSPIVAGGTGEIVYVMAGTRHTDGARSVSGEALELGTEVVIMRRDKGIAFVERFEKLAGQNVLPKGGTEPAQEG